MFAILGPMDHQSGLDRRKKLTQNDKQEIAVRMQNRAQTGITAEAIAAEFGITREWAQKIAARFKPNENGPSTAMHGA